MTPHDWFERWKASSLLVEGSAPMGGALDLWEGVQDTFLYIPQQQKYDIDDLLLPTKFSFELRAEITSLRSRINELSVVSHAISQLLPKVQPGAGGRDMVFALGTSFVFTAFNIRQIFGRLSEVAPSDEARRDLSALVDEIDSHLPGLKPIRDSAAHEDERRAGKHHTESLGLAFINNWNNSKVSYGDKDGIHELETAESTVALLHGYAVSAIGIMRKTPA